MKILIISDAWYPQLNGVVRTLEATIAMLRHYGHEVQVVGPDASRWCSIAAPTYPDIRLEFLARPRRLIAYAGLRRFHAPSSAVMVATPSIEAELRKRRFRRIARWSRGVNTDIFKLYGKQIEAFSHLPRPILLYVGRVAVEKNLAAFLELKTTGSKVVIGEGPDLAKLRAEYLESHFLGKMEGEILARHYAAADLFVFPSTTDTFGLVLIEACAAGLRIASYPAPGPVDIFNDPRTHQFAGLDKNLQQAVDHALSLPDNPEIPHAFASEFSWAACTQQFYENLQARTPRAVKRITRFREWLKRWWLHLRQLPREQ